MKKLLVFLGLIIAGITASAQDVIVKKDGSTVLCKIVNVSPTEVIYLKWSDLYGPQYIMDSSLISNINYQDGRQDKLNEPTTNAYTPGNQQTGNANYNDNALLKLDVERNKISGECLKQIKRIKTIGWSIGGLCMLTGGALLTYAFIVDFAEIAYINNLPDFYYSGGAIMACGLATTAGCLIKAHQIKKQAQMFAHAPVLKKEFAFIGGTSVSAGVDLISNNQERFVCAGLGFQFNF